MQRLVPALVASALLLAPHGARAADLVVWWEKGFYPQEDAAVREIIAAFEQETGKQVELVRNGRDLDQQTAAVQAAIDAGRPPDFLFGQVASNQIPRWAEEGRLVDLTDTIGALKDLFDADTLELSTLRNGRDGRTALYALPMARDTTHVHVWQSLLKQAGLTLNDIPTGWDAFWSFWCDRAQPAVRKALGRDDIWGTGMAMSAGSVDTRINYTEFQLAYGTPWASSDGRLQVEDPAVRAGMIQALDSYTAIWRKGCTPPELGRLDGQRQQPGLPRAAGDHDDQQHVVDPQPAQGDATRRLSRQRSDHRLAERPRRQAASDLWIVDACRRVRRRRPRRHGPRRSSAS